MNLLFDQNISFRIVRILKDLYPEAKQVKDVGLENSNDLVIWQYAKENNFAIVTFDADFYDLSLVKGIPPKIIWLRIGNTSTRNIVKTLRDNNDLIKEFLAAKEYHEISCLELN